ncbi:fatty acid desaturase CarF family protein [soil metagenome]
MNAAYSRTQRLLEVCSIGAFALFGSWGAWRLALIAGWQLAPILLVALPLGWLASDLVSGLVHWACDSWGSANTPVVGQAFIRPFREHHEDPQAMTRHDFVETNGSSCFASLPVLIAAGLMPLENLVWMTAQAFLLSLSVGVLATNQCHKWAHMTDAAIPPLAGWAQRYRLSLPRRHHALHHMPPYNTHFCISSGWLNSLFNAVLRWWR